LCCARAGEAKPKPPGRFEVMDYGPFLISTLNCTGNNVVPKSVTIHLDADKKHNVSFDTELLRVACGWSGGYHNWDGPTFSGAHADGPTIKGTVQFATKVAAGWAKDGTFDDPRKAHDGVLPPDWARYKGLYVNNGKVVLSYTVGDCKILEMESLIS